MEQEIYSVRELQRQLSQALRTVRAGGRIVVTANRIPIAAIVPSSDEIAVEDAVERRVRRLAERGWVVQKGKRGPSRRIRGWNLGPHLVRDFLTGRR